MVFINFVAALRGYQSSMAEADKLFDEQLLEIAHLVASLDTERPDSPYQPDSHLAFQVWEDGVLVGASGRAPLTPISELTPGFDHANFNGYRWRTYALRDEQQGRWVILAERTDLRYMMAGNVALESVTPIIMGLPVIALLVWLIVSIGLRPLRQLSHILKGKQPADLSPLNIARPHQELRQVVESINGFIERLSAAMEREKRFSADVAHELRTPISAMKIQLHNMAHEISPDQESYQQLLHSVERLQHLVEQLLSLYRISPEQFSTQCRELDLSDLVRRVIVSGYPSIDQKQQSLELLAEPAWMIGDAALLEMLVSNLLNNASKYTPSGGAIRIEVRQTSTTVLLKVADNGPGIDVSERIRIFDRFYRGRNHQRQSGCGLGLAIVSRVAQLHEARIVLEDSPFGSGAAFSLCFRRVNHDVYPVQHPVPAGTDRLLRGC